MNHASVIRVSALLFSALGLAMTPSAAFSVAEGDYMLAATFVSTAVFSILLALIVVILTPKSRNAARPRDGLAVVVLFWVIAPLIAAPPFIVAASRPDVLAGVHEAVACLTTTGHSVVRLGTDEWPASLVIWRGVLHLMGALVTLTTVATVFAALNLGGPGIHRTVLFTLSDTSFFRSIFRVFRTAALVLMTIVLFAFLTLAASGAGYAASMTNAVSIATTGLVDPAGADARAPSALQGAIIMIGLAASTLGLFNLIEGAAGRLGNAVKDPETIVWMGLMGFLIVAAIIAGAGPIGATGFMI
ncbi:MAG: hypothetical protein AAFQ67_07465, partial [Pseudomonadota bacterium]